MNRTNVKKKTLAIGCDFPAFHSYWRNYNHWPNIDIIGFVYCYPGMPPVPSFKGAPIESIPIYPLEQLETVIKENRIQVCEMFVSDLSIPKVNSIINRITSIGSCKIEFQSPTKNPIRSNKPVIEITSLAPKLGKSQLGRYICDILSSKLHRTVAVIIPIHEIPPNNEAFNAYGGPHFEFKENDSVPSDVLSNDDEWNIKQYQRAGAFRIYATSNYRKAIISAEQHADIIIFDSKGCENPSVDSRSKICVATEESLMHIRKNSLWPGLLNVLLSKHILIITDEIIHSVGDSPDTVSPELQQRISGLLPKSYILFFAGNQYQTDKWASNEELDAIKNAESIITIDHKDSQGDAEAIVQQMGAKKQQIDPSPFLTEGLEVQNKTIVSNSERCLSPTPEISKENSIEMEKINNAINRSNADLLVVTLQKDFKSIQPNKKIVHVNRSIYDFNNDLSKFLDQYSLNHITPPLQKHFEAQVDILVKMANASDSELYVVNNDSSNREAFCRLFLASHLPSSYTVKTGEIIDAFSNSTGQLDVVIVNDVCPRMTIDATSSVIAPIMADDVLGVVEVKTTLTLDSFKKALNQLRPVKALMTSHGTLKKPDGEIVLDPLRGKIITGIFAFRGESIDQHIFSLLASYPGVVDFIVVLDSFCYFSAATLYVCGLNFDDSAIINGYCKFNSRGIGLALIFGILNCLAAVRRFSGANCVKYIGGGWPGSSAEVQRHRNEASKSIREMVKSYARIDSAWMPILRYGNQCMSYIDELREQNKSSSSQNASSAQRTSKRTDPPPRSSSPISNDLCLSLSCDSDDMMYNDGKNT